MQKQGKIFFNNKMLLREGAAGSSLGAEGFI
jgi:hypothetical protein